MSKSSEAVKKWRKTTKSRIVESMGGECYCCTYDVCDDALELHHLDPTIKTFGFGGIRANPVSWDRIVEELRKCILLCSNCHREVEAGVRDIGNAVSTFNEAYVEYRRIQPEGRGHTEFTFVCEGCSREFPKYSNRQKYCSDICNPRKRRIL